MNADVIDLKCCYMAQFQLPWSVEQIFVFPPFLSEKGNLFEVIPFFKSKRHSISVVYIRLPLIHNA